MKMNFEQSSFRVTAVLVAAAMLHNPQSALAGGAEAVSVVIDGAEWSQGACCPLDLITITSDPAILVVDPAGCGRTVIATVDGANSYFTGDNCSSNAVILENFTLTDSGTGATIDPPIKSGTGYMQWQISNPTKPGTITITADLAGKCNTGDPGSCQTCDRHWQVTGTLQVVLPPDPNPAPPPQPVNCGKSCGDGPSAALATGSLTTSGDTGLEFRLNLGLASPTADAGFIWLQAQSPSSALARPLSLTVPFARPGVVVTNGSDGAIKQVKVPQGLVNISVKDNCEYHLECFYQTNVGSVDTNGYYTTNGSAFATWVVKNPTGNTNTCNTLQLIEQRPGLADRQFQYAYTPDNLMWDLQRPTGQTNCSCRVRVSDTVTNYQEQVLSAGQTLKQRQRMMETRAGVALPLVTQSIEGSSTSFLTNTYTYYSSDSTNGYFTNKLQRVDYSNGNWEYYKYDSFGRTQTVYSAYLNNSPPASGEPNPTNDHCKVVEYAYALTNQIGGQDFDGVDDPGDPFNPWLARKLVMKLPVQVGGNWEVHEVARMYHTSIWTNGYEETRQCITPGALWSNTANLKTVTYWSTNRDFSYRRPITVTDPAGLTTTWSYATNSTTQTDPDGTVTVTMLDSLGQITSRTQTVGGITVVSDTYTYTDALQLSHDVTDLAGRITHYTYACCGLDSVTDPDGMTTQYDYDSLKRQVASTRLYGGGTGIKTTNMLDETGKVVVTKRQGTDATWITQNQTQYDLLGRPVRITNALGGVTTITNVILSTRQCITNTYPDGGTRIELYYRDGRIEQVFGSAVSHPTHYSYGIEQDGTNGPWRVFYVETKTDAGGNDSSEWIKTYTDAADRSYKTLYAAASAPYPSALTYFNSGGQLTNQVDPDGISTIYVYNGKGQRTHTVLDTNRNYTIDYSGDDRITFVTNDVISSHGTNLRRRRTYVWSTSGSSVSNLISMLEVSADGLQSWSTIYPDSSTSVVSSNRTVYAGSGNRYQTNVAPDGSFTVSAFSYGRLASVTRKDSLNNQLSSVSHSYDSHGRQSMATDARNGTTAYTFNNADQVTSVTTPNPGTRGGSAQTTTTDYDVSKRVWRLTQPDGAATTNEFYPTGLRKRIYGGRNYPVSYGYDSQGRMIKMTNWTSFASGAGERVTTWNYNAYRGWLDNKRYPDSKGTDYTYTPGGRNQTRLWARGTNTTYAFDNLGAISRISYNDGATPGVTNEYDRRGRLSCAAAGPNSTSSLTYNDANQLLSETNSAGTLAGLRVTNCYDQFMRRTNLSALNASTLLTFSTYSYDSASRFASVSDGTNSATYTYLANSPLVNQIVFKSNTVTRLTTTKQYDFLNRLSSISNQPSSAGESPISFFYDYNSANQTIRRVEADYSYWRYEYDSLGQVKSGKKYWADQTPVAGQQFEYLFDDIGNRIQTKSGGDEVGQSLRAAYYYVNGLNQYTNRDIAGYIDVLGQAFATSSVTVNALSAYRRGEYFRNESSVANNSATLWTNVIVAASGQASVTGNVFVAKTPESFTYDADGNLTSDGRWNYTWDGENRLSQMVANTAIGPQQLLKFQYDSRGRRIRKQVWSNTAGTNTPSVDIAFIYDGWNQIAILNAEHSTLNIFVWGLDLTGSLQRGGGVGGLLEISDASNGPQYVAFDGNGNLVTLVTASDGSPSARYDYDSFGQIVRSTGVASKTNPVRFSTKFYDDETDLICYGKRFYMVSTGRWLSRDPIGETGGRGLYVLCGNHPIGTVDALGEKCADPCGQFQRDPSLTGAVICCEGDMYLCVWEPFPGINNSKATQVIKNCLLDHENSHAYDVKDCDKCRKDIYRPDYKRPHMNDSSECKAWTAEYYCLLSNIGDCGDDADCRLQVMGQANEVYRTIVGSIPNCPKPPPPPWWNPIRTSDEE